MDLSFDENELFVNTMSQKLVEFFLTLEGTYNYNCSNFEKIDIKKELTHEYLIYNYEIDTEILQFYRKSIDVIRLDYKKLDYSFSSLLPYSFVINGARVFVPDLILSIQVFVNSLNKERQKFKCNDKLINSFEDLIPYYKDYSKGFEIGFNTFEDEIKSILIKDISDKNDFVLKVFEFITEKSNMFSEKRSWSEIHGFTKDFLTKSIVNGYENGLIQGYFYKAWSIVFLNKKLFLDLFRNLNKGEFQNKQLTQINENLHSDVFKKNGFKLFDYILNNYVSNNRGRKSDLNFYYRKLYKEDYIIESCKPENFKYWYEVTFDDDFGQIKTLDEVTTQIRNRDYSTSLEWFKQQKYQ